MMLVSHEALGKNVCKLFGGINLANTNIATHMRAKGKKGGPGRFCSQM